MKTRTWAPRRGLGRILAVAAAGLLSAATLVAEGTSAQASTTGAPDLACNAPGHSGAKAGHIGGIVHAVKRGCSAHHTSDASIGTPPLLWHNGPVMGTDSTGPVVVTPIYWNPSGHPIPAGYQSVINTYLQGVAADSGQRTNVFSTATGYFGTNGPIRYQVDAAAAISDTDPLPASSCKVATNDTRKIYADGSGYNACLDDDQIIAETDQVINSHRLPRDLGHIYVMFLPKHVESCFIGGSTTTAKNECTINHHKSAAYCAYHSQAPSGAVYATMPFPIYNSNTGYTCGTEKDFGSIQSPNGNPDADVEVSPTSHEIMEAVTDPDVNTGWYDASGYENGDECAYVFGTTQGTPGALYNQVINGHHYLTQEEFSNRDFAATGLGCLPYE